MKRPHITPAKKLPLFPTASSQHVRSCDSHEEGLVHALRQYALPFAPRQSPSDPKGKARATDDLRLPQTGLAQRIKESTTNGSLDRPVTTSKPGQRSTAAALTHLTAQSTHAHLPPFQAITHHTSHLSPASPWTHRWRPRKADQVLANAQVAKYLASWLRVLQITSKRSHEPGDTDADSQDPLPPKKRLKRAGQRALVDDEESLDSEESELIAFFNQFNSRTPASRPSHSNGNVMPDEDDDEQPAQVTTPQPPLTTEQTPLDFDPNNDLCNAILLIGPPGSGKTATVHACAQELGYEVFELNPGMGRRSKQDLHEAVGKVGRYHMVTSRGDTSTSNKSPFSAMMSPAQGTPSNGASSSSSSPSSHGQSLILIEEVDILAKDDVAFWTGVKELVSVSRRPVIMTCNDPAFVPVDDFPLQEVLHCQLPPVDLSVEYLRFIAAAEGCGVLTPGQVQRRIGLVNDAHDQGSGIDLRQAINQLQFACRTGLQDDATTQGAGTGTGTVTGTDHEHLPASALNGTASSSSPSSQDALDLQALRQSATTLSHQSTLVSHFTRPHVRQAAIDDPSPRRGDRDRERDRDRDSSREVSASKDDDGEAPPPPPDELTLPSSWRALHSEPTDTAATVTLPLNGREDEYVHEYMRYLISVSPEMETHKHLLPPLRIPRGSTWARTFHRDLKANLHDLVVLLDPHLRSVKYTHAALLAVASASASDVETMTSSSSSWCSLTQLYAPTLRYIVLLEDQQEREMIQMVQMMQQQQGQDISGTTITTGTRSTRNSSRLTHLDRHHQFTRVFDVGEAALHAARRSAGAFGGAAGGGGIIGAAW